MFDPSEPKRQRLLVDGEVARLMADFWTTFAMYGDPNGLPSRNGIVGGTRPRYVSAYFVRLYSVRG
jgi:hypothetical protein